MSEQRDPSSTLFERREVRLAALDRLPRTLWLGSMINSQGSLEPRLQALHGMREALAAGQLPGEASVCWPDASLASGLHATFLRLRLPELCRDRIELTDQVLSSMLWHLDLIVDYVDRGDNEEDAIARALDGFGEEWQERRSMIDELEAVFGPTGDMLKSTNWDLLRGLLASEGWREIVRVRRAMTAMPELTELLRRLGRARPSDDEVEPNRMERQVEERTSVLAPRVRITRVPELPGETRGVYRSGRIARMLPSETMLLTHRRLRLVWHAHHAERSLLTYEEDERMQQVVLEPAFVVRTTLQRVPDRRMQAGPMLVCLDTSGSMRGGAEVVAKAVVLEAMRTARAQQRACHVFAFGGPDEIVELELRLDIPGVEQLAGFLCQGFHGGTDICGPLERVLARLSEARWRGADLLIASDGEFGATADTAAATARAKTELGLRIQGILIGDRETIGMLELADDIFWVREWRRYGGSDVASPAQSKSLTATYFPGALRAAKQDATGDGTHAAPPRE